MPTIAFLLLATLRDTFRSRVALQLEVLALRQQLATMKRSASRSSLRSADRPARYTEVFQSKSLPPSTAPIATCASHLSHPGCIKNADRSAGTGDGTIFAVRRA